MSDSFKNCILFFFAHTHLGFLLDIPEPDVCRQNCTRNDSSLEGSEINTFMCDISVSNNTDTQMTKGN